jgi:glucose-1-phosphate cytidylyltransferase
MASNDFQQIPVVILCGGNGIVAGENQPRVNKALVRVNGKPMFWWVLQHYALYGATQFMLATGMQSERFGPELKELGASETAEAGVYTLNVCGAARTVRLVASDPAAGTAQRLMTCQQWLKDAPTFALTYSDTLSDLDLSAELRFHRNQELVATLVGATYPVRFRVLGIRYGESLVRTFAPRPVIETASVNGGFYLFDAKVWDAQYGVADAVALETTPLEKLAAASQLAAYTSKSRWQHCDAERDIAVLDKLAKDLAALAA